MEIDREAFLFEFESRLEQWNATIAGLEKRRPRGEEQNAVLSQRIESLAQRRNTLENKVEKVRQCSARAWRSVSREVERAAREVEEAWTCVASALSRSEGEEPAVLPPNALPAEAN